MISLVYKDGVMNSYLLLFRYIDDLEFLSFNLEIAYDHVHTYMVDALAVLFHNGYR